MLRFDEKMESQGIKSKEKQKGKQIQSSTLVNTCEKVLLTVPKQKGKQIQSSTLVNTYEKVQLTVRSAAFRQSSSLGSVRGRD